MKKYIFIFVFLFVVFGSVVFGKLGFSKKIDDVKVKSTFDYNVLTKKEEEENYKIDVYYLNSKYEKLNLKIEEIVNEYVSTFKERLEGFSKDKNYSLDMNFEIYESRNVVSIVFNIIYDYKCLNKENYIATIVYDMKNDKIINMQDLVLEDEELLDKLSTYSYKYLNDNLNKENKEELREKIKSGTDPFYENYERFAINKNKLIIYFKEYQISYEYFPIQKVEYELNY